MAILYKLTDTDGFTRRGEYNECQWGEGVSHSGTGKGELCGPGYIHAYTSPLLAVLLNPIHASIDNPKLWECEGEIVRNNIGNNKSDLININASLKCGCITLTTIREIPLPIISIKQKIKFAILCSLEVYKESAFVDWANEWLSDKDRSTYANDAAAHAAAYAAADAAKNITLNLIAIANKAMEE